MNSDDFANKLCVEWDKEAYKMKFSEINQFRALMKSFGNLKSAFKVEEFHGMKHQVKFVGAGKWGRNPARCEISDLLFLSYTTVPEFKARITFLQAKKSNGQYYILHCCYFSCCNCFLSPHPLRFMANLEQWDLLSRRPSVTPHPPFRCKNNILSGAILPSVGSIGVFHETGGVRDFFYMSADIASPLNSPSNKHATLEKRKVNPFRQIKGFGECVFSGCVYSFAKNLFEIKIGTPLEGNHLDSMDDGLYRKEMREWIASILRGHLISSDRDELLDRELLAYLSSDEEGEWIENPPSIIILNCNSDEKDRPE